MMTIGKKKNPPQMRGGEGGKTVSLVKGEGNHWRREERGKEI